jgi:hypothetical protein
LQNACIDPELKKLDRLCGKQVWLEKYLRELQLEQVRRRRAVWSLSSIRYLHPSSRSVYEKTLYSSN